MNKMYIYIYIYIYRHLHINFIRRLNSIRRRSSIRRCNPIRRLNLQLGTAMCLSLDALCQAPRYMALRRLGESSKPSNCIGS